MLAVFILALLGDAIVGVTVTGGPKLSLPRALMPLNVDARPLLLHVSATSTCYTWSSSREDVITVQEIKDARGCSVSAKVSTHPYINQRQTAIVFAEDVYTKQILRCDVILDKISYLEIVTTSRELFVEEAPEAFEVRAYDDQGNEFTTLDGVEFSWTVVSNLKDNEVIRIITFSESSYEASDVLKEMEVRGLRGHTVLLEGVSTGVAKVFVKLPHADYASVKTAEVTLRVVANLLIMPADISVLLQDTVDFKIIQVREGRLIEIPQPSSQYWLEIEDSSIATLDKTTGRAVGKKLGHTKVLLKDFTEVATNGDIDVVRLPEANIRVVTPHSLKLELRPVPTSRIWSIECDTKFTLIVYILDNQRKRIHVGSETRISLKINEAMVDVEWRSINGTTLNGIARQSGLVPVEAKLLSIAGKTVHNDISTTGEIHIFDKIEVIPPKSFIPLHSRHQQKSEIHLKARGGDGIYVWHGEGSASVDPRGLVTANAVGNATIVASMASNTNIFGTANVIISEPMSMEVIWYEEEGPVGSALSVHVALFGAMPPDLDTLMAFTSCNPKSFSLTSIEGNRFDLVNPEVDSDEKLIGSACTVLHVQCLESGGGLVKVQWGHLDAGLSLRCFDPLQSVFPPPHMSLLLTVGSSHNIIFKGGPTMWFDGETDKLQEMINSHPKIASVVPYKSYSDYGQRVYTVTCLELGKTEARLVMHGNDDIEGTVSKSTEAIVDVDCMNPHSLKLSLKQNISDACPTASLSQMLVLSGGEPIEVEVMVFDINGRQFHNATSLRYRWSSKPTSIIPELPLERLLIKLDLEFDVPIVDYHYQIVRIFGEDIVTKSGMGEIVVEVIGFRSAVMKLANVQTIPPLKTPPKTSLSIKLITSVNVANKKMTVFNYPSNIVTVPLSNGSGNFQISLSNGGYAQVSLDSRNLKIKPISDGDFTVYVTDLCVSYSPLVIQVRVVSVANIITNIPELIEKGKSVSCVVYFYDRTGVVLPAYNAGAPSLIARITEGSVDAIPSDVQTDEVNGMVYNVTGLEIGDANIEFTAGNIRGIAHTFVFPPLTLIPQHSIILPDGHVKIGVSGGPPPPATILFTRNMRHFDVIDVTENGIVKGIDVGTASVEAHAEGFRGADSVHASATVQVVSLEGINIHGPTTTLLVKNSMPLWAVGIPDSITPLQLGSLKPSLHFRWSISGDGVVSITDALGATEIEFDNSDRVAVRLMAIHPGSVTVYLNVTAIPGSIMARTCGQTWSAKFDMTVIQPLLMINPPIKTTHLLVAPHSEVQLKTNFPSEKLTFVITEDSDRVNKGSLLAKVSPEGKLITFGRLGFGVIVISSVDAQVSKQHLSIAFEICAPHYSMLDIDKSHAWNRLSGLGGLPSGLTLPMILKRYDIYGRKFSSSPKAILHHTNRPDLVLSAGNSSNIQEVLLFETGSAVIKVWDTASEKQFSDYISVKILPAVYPLKITATVGDVWCMRSAIRNGSWYDNLGGTVWAANTGMIQARASRVAATALIFKSPSDLPLITQATVITRPADRIYFLESNLPHVVTDLKPLTLNLVLANHEESHKVSNLILESNECLVDDFDFFPFACEIRRKDDTLASPIYVEPVFDKTLGKYGCKITWSPLTSAVFANISHGISIVATMGSFETESIHVRCIRSAVVQPDKVSLSPSPAHLAPVDVMGPPEVLKQVKLMSETDVLQVDSPIVISDSNIRYIVRATKTIVGVQKFNIRLLSPLTRQDIEMQVSANGHGLDGICELGGGSSIVQYIERYQLVLLFIVTCVAVTGATIYVLGNVFPSRESPSNSVMAPKPPVDLASSIRNITYQSRSPMSRTSSESFGQQDLSSSFHQTPPGSPPSLDTSGSAVYGDPSFMASLERRRNRRFI